MNLRTTTTLLAVLGLATFAFAGEKGKGKEKKPNRKAIMKEAATNIQKAVSKGDATAAKFAFTRAEGLRGEYNDKEFGPIVKALGAGVGHKDQQIASGAVTTLGTLKVVGSGKALGKLLKPAAKPKEGMLELHKAAIAAAGSIHDPESLKTLEKLLTHANTEIAVASAEALKGYRSVDEKVRNALVKRLVKILGGVEKKAATAKDDAKSHAESVRDAISGALTALTGKDGITSAADWSKWIKEQAKA